MRTNTLTTLFNAHRLSGQVNEVLSKIENQSFDTDELSKINDALNKVNIMIESVNNKGINNIGSRT